jgi:hypothetical protein
MRQLSSAHAVDGAKRSAACWGPGERPHGMLLVVMIGSVRAQEGPFGHRSCCPLLLRRVAAGPAARNGTKETRNIRWRYPWVTPLGDAGLAPCHGALQPAVGRVWAGLLCALPPVRMRARQPYVAAFATLR